MGMCDDGEDDIIFALSDGGGYDAFGI